MKDINACPVDESCFAAQDEDGRTPLHFAARRGNVELAKHMINLLPSPSINQTDRNGQTAFHCATESKRVEIIDVMKDGGMDVRGRDHRRRSLLHHAALHDNLDAVRKVVALAGRQELELRDLDGRTPFQLAERYGVRSVVEYLMSEYGAETAMDRAEESQRLREQCCAWRTATSFGTRGFKTTSLGTKGVCSVGVALFALSVMFLFLTTFCQRR